MDTAAQSITIASRDSVAVAALYVPPGARGAPGAAVPPGAAPGAVVLHGYGSRKENHLDFAERLAGLGIAVVVPDLRGHGETGGDMDEGMIGDVVACLDHLRARGFGPLGVRGSSMGGFLALTAAPMHPDVRVVVAICPARPESLARRLGRDWPRAHPLEASTWRHDGIARGFWHARDDEVVPWQGTFALFSRAPQPKHLRIEMGGHHRSLQHDAKTQAETAAFMEHALNTPASPPPVPGT